MSLPVNIYCFCSLRVMGLDTTYSILSLITSILWPFCRIEIKDDTEIVATITQKGENVTNIFSKFEDNKDF